MTDVTLPSWLLTNPQLSRDDLATLTTAALLASLQDTTTPSPDDNVADFVPDDAGEWADGLAAALRRIPPGSEPCLSVNAGWYQLVVELDRTIASIEPRYELHQVKEKYGGLRYHIGLPDDICCAQTLAAVDAMFPARPADDDSDARAAWTATHEDAYEAAYIDAMDTHERDIGHTDDIRTNDIRDLIGRVVNAAEHASESTCERTGGPGMQMFGPGRRVATLDPVIAEPAYVIGAAWTADQVNRALAGGPDPEMVARLVHSLAARTHQLTLHTERLRAHIRQGTTSA